MHRISIILVAENSPIPVRLSPELIQRLDDAAKKIGNTRAGIIRFCTDTWLAHFEKHGRAALPPDWDQILAAFDNRTQESRRPHATYPRTSSKAAALNDKIHKSPVGKAGSDLLEKGKKNV